MAATPEHWQLATVLVVDDHPAYRLLVGTLLGRLGVAHECACDGREALKILGARHFDLVISDCRMPVMDGFDMTRELRKQERAAGVCGVPVIALTAALGPQEWQRCLDVGMDGWLIKPITLEHLRDVLLHWLAAPDFVSAALTVGEPPGGTSVCLPTRAGLIATFGSWAVVEHLLSCLVLEAREDLVALALACAGTEVDELTQRLHRLVGSVVFLGATGLEQQGIDLIERVLASGVRANRPALEQFQHDVERYVCYLANL